VKVFVYGTLKQGYGNNILLRDQAFLGENVTKFPVFDMTSEGIPFVHPEGSSFIKGEMYEIDEACLERVDSLEGHPNWYKREEVEIATGDTAYMYMTPSPGPMYHSYLVEPNERNEVCWN